MGVRVACAYSLLMRAIKLETVLSRDHLEYHMYIFTYITWHYTCNLLHGWNHYYMLQGRPPWACVIDNRKEGVDGISLLFVFSKHHSVCS